MALPKEPRQKMINLMYLVLTALLALNVSAEILNAFKTVDNSLRTANGVIEGENQLIFKSFDSLLADKKTQERAMIWKPKADSAKMLADAMYSYLEGIKKELIQASKPEPNGSYNEEELEATTRIMTEGTRGKELLAKLGKYKSDLLGISPEINSTFATDLPIDLKIPPTKNIASKNDWSSAYFRMVPTVAAVTILSKFENDVKNSEALVVNYCHQQVGTVKVVYDQYKPLVGQSSNYLMPGQELTITAGVGSYSSAAKPDISIDGQPVQINPTTGVAEFKTNVGGPNAYTKNVHISFFNQATGKQESLEYPVKYTVGSPTGASVSADAVKVLYIGLKNPLTITGGTVGDERVTASIDNGDISKEGGGKYIAEPATAGKATIHLLIDGKPQDFDFRVKNVPDPVGVVGTNKGGRMKVNEFKAQFGVGALLENFVFEGVKFNVVSYTIVCTGSGFPQLKFADVQGNSFDPVRASIIEQVKPGTTVTIDNIRASGPGGVRPLPPIVFNLF